MPQQLQKGMRVDANGVPLKPGMRVDENGIPIEDPGKPQAPPSATERYLGGVWENWNPIAQLQGLGNTILHPIDTAKGAWEAQKGEFNKAQEQMARAALLESSGDSESAADARTRSVMHMITTAIPLAGPALGNAYDKMKEGDYAGGMGEMTGIVAPSPFGKVGKAGAVKVLQKAAPTAEKFAARALVRGVAPTGGPNRLRFGPMVAENAKEVLRDPTLSAWTRQGFLDKITDAVEGRKATIDAMHDRRGSHQVYSTAPVAKKLLSEEDALTAHAVDATSTTPRTIPLREGDGTLTFKQGGTPVGQSTVPPLNRPNVGILREERAALESLGPQARYEELRRLRDAADKGAQKVYTPSIATDFLNQRDIGRTYAKVAGAYRDALAEIDPSTARANQAFSRYKNVFDAVQAAEEQDLTRPNRGLRAIATATGGALGTPGGILGIVGGAMAGRGVQSLLDAGFTPGIKVGRSLQRGADAWSAGKGGRILNFWDAATSTSPLFVQLQKDYEDEQKRQAIIAELEAAKAIK